MEENSAGTVRAEALSVVSRRDLDLLSVAIRVYPDTKEFEENIGPRWPASSRPNAMFVFDTETRVDETQKLTFGSYRFIVAGGCLEEGLVYGDDLPQQDRKVLEEYVSIHKADTADGDTALRLLSRSQFADRLFSAAYKGRCLLVAFNFPFDISRVACSFTDARDRYAGGFSLRLWSYVSDGRTETDRYRPGIVIKQIDSKRALKAFAGRNEPDKEDQIPEGSLTGTSEKDYVFHGHFVDLRTLAFVLTDRGYSLEGACEAFDVEHPKTRIKRHGEVTQEYIDYNRRDVLATTELAAKLLEEYDKHPISLQVTKAYSPASIGKAYLREMGITPILERQPDFPKQYLGYAQSAFFGGRTSAHVRKIAVPVIYTDFLSMYTTVNRLMNLWRFVTARRIRVISCKREVRKFLSDLTANDLFKPKTWKRMPAFVRIIPDGDILPSRARYNNETNDWQVAVNHIYARGDDTKDGLWFSLPDIVASKLLTGRVPKIVDAFRIVPQGTMQGLKPVKFRGTVEIDPINQDFFKVVIEERKRLPSRTDLSGLEKDRLDKALKVLASATSYGIYAEMNRQESDEKVNVTCLGIDPEPFACRVAHADVPGEYCFPPLASLITAAARLMLALLEHCVTAMGGTYAMEDTDSMAIVSTKRGGLVPCPGGPFRMRHGCEAIKALSWSQVRSPKQRFAALNPYAVSGSILKIEDDNFDPISEKQRQLYCLAISAKRYALFLRDQHGGPVLLRASCPYCGHNNKPSATECTNCYKPVHVNNQKDRWSEHGLGHLLNPTDPDTEDREWIAQAWQNIIRKALGLKTCLLPYEQVPAVGRVTISSPAVMRPFGNLNADKPYPDQRKPFSFFLTCYVDHFGQPLGVEHTARFHLITSYETDPRRWDKKDWIDQYSGTTYRITTQGDYGTREAARVKTYGETLVEYEYHAESKCADIDGKACGKRTIGLLQRRHIRIEQIKCIGKESNSLEEVESGLIHSAQSVYTEYPDARRDEWETLIRPALGKVPLSQLVRATKLSRRTLIDARTGRRRPHLKNQGMIAAAVKRLRGI